jgi:hypothetical protein
VPVSLTIDLLLFLRISLHVFAQKMEMGLARRPSEVTKKPHAHGTRSIL